MAKQEDLAQFEKLITSPMRSEQRERALQAWQDYKLGRQAEYVKAGSGRQARAGYGKSGIWRKGDYIRSLTAPAIDLSGADFRDVCVGYADLRGVRFDDAAILPSEMAWCALKGANLAKASLRNSRLAGIRMMEASLSGADLTNADFSNADLSRANLEGATLTGVSLAGANLQGANLVRTNIDGAILDGARVYGVSAWDLEGTPASSRDLIVTPEDAPAITADDVRVAQFIYLMISNREIRDVLDTLTRKVVLLLGRFRADRKAVLEALKGALRQKNLVPVIFDFDVPADRDVTETVTLLARMARFLVADLTEPASIPQELQAVAPDVAVPIRLIIQKGFKPYSMSKDLRKYAWVIRPFRYKDIDHLLESLDAEILEPVEAVRRTIAEWRKEDE